MTNACTPEPTTALADDLNIRYYQYGEGKPLVLVHGWGADTHSNWVATGWTDALSKHRSVIAIDVRGHGQSDKPHATAPYSYAAMSNDVIAVMDALNIRQADYMGYSMGAFMGAYLLAHHPGRFTAMVLGGIGDETAASAAQGDVIAAALRAPDSESITNPAARGIRMFVEGNPDNDLEALAFSAAAMWPEGYPMQLAGPGISAARFPVLIVNGSEDHPYVDSADAFAAALPDGRHVQIPGADHLTAVTDARFKDIVVEFLLSLD